ncbi:cell wall hydrolase [Heyndrickxia sp. NPDC080065]|uniref:cell wall hydrolase n=1 Tax=Heyndrickxia sp. NPDC080065 TaxID=3390568 RepID=UPI003D02FC4D
MKKTYIFKSLVVAFAATFGFIDIQNLSAEAATNHQVVKGDSLWKLGQHYGVTIDHIKKENNRSKDWIYTGEKLQIPNKKKGSAKHSSNNKTETRDKDKVSISNAEKDLLSRLVEAEAKGESYKGKVAVATVVLNRVDSRDFPNSVTGVIKQVVGHSYAFSPVQNGAINKHASDEAKRAVDEALKRTDRLNNSIYFYNPDIATDNWIRSRKVVKTIGHHVFAK